METFQIVCFRGLSPKCWWYEVQSSEGTVSVPFKTAELAEKFIEKAKIGDYSFRG
jgi:hypothetical protein